MRVPSTARRPRRLMGIVAFVLVAAATTAQAAATSSGTAAATSSDPLAGPAWSSNLFVGDKSTFDHTAGGWVGNANTTARRVPFPTQAGSGSLAIINSSAKVGTAWVSSGD